MLPAPRRRTCFAPMRLVAFLTAALLTATACIFAGPTAYAQDAWPTVLKSGKINIFDLDATPEGASSLALSVDGQRYEPEKTLIEVSASTRMSVPGLTPPVDGYVVAAGAHKEDPKAIELGWDLSALAKNRYTGAHIKIEGKGPQGARVLVFTRDGQGRATAVTEAGTLDLSAASRIDISDLRAQDTTWVFTRAGTYTFEVSALAKDSENSIFSSRSLKTYTIHVGEGSANTAGLHLLNGDGPAAPDADTPGTPSVPDSDDDDNWGDDEDASEEEGEGDAAPNRPQVPAQQEDGTPGQTGPFTGDTAQLVGPEKHPVDPVSGREMLFRTHVDATHVYWDKETQQLKIGVIDGKTLRPADRVAVRLGPDADEEGNEVSRFKVPEGKRFAFLGQPGRILWNAPAQFFQGWRPVWAGYGAGFMPEHLDKDSLQLELVGVEGPGDMIVWRSGGDFVAEDFNSASATKRVTGMVPGGHGHINWSFSAQGRYVTKWRAKATTVEGAPLTSDIYEVLWLVGHDENLGLDAGTTPSATISVPADEDRPNNTPSIPLPSGEEEVEEEAQAPQVGSYVCAAPGHYDYRASTDSAGKVGVVLRDDSVTPAVDRTSYSVIVPVPDAASTLLDTSGNRQALAALGRDGARIWTLPEVQDKRLPWLGFNTADVDYTKISPAGVRVSLQNHEGPGRIIHWDGGTISPAKILLDSANYDLRIPFTQASHRHVAMSFNQPGLYSISYGFTPNYTKESGFGRAYRFFDTYFAVGNASIEKHCPGYLAQHGLAGIDGGSNNGETPGDADNNTPPGGADNSTPPGGTPDLTLPIVPPHTSTPGTNNGAADGVPSGKSCVPAGVDTVLDSGHVDLFTLKAGADKSISLKVTEDVTGQRVVRDPSAVLLRVKESAWQTLDAAVLPQGVPTQAYFLPQAQDNVRGLVWPGWDTMEARSAGLEKTTFDVSYTGPKDGRISMWLAGAFTGFESRLADGGYTLNPQGSQIVQSFPAHTHVNWAFSHAGRYTLTVRATASSSDGATQVHSEPVTYTIDVGKVQCPTVAVAARTVERGNSIDIEAKNLTPASQVVFEVHSDVVTLPGITADADGNARTRWQVPANFPLGTHHIKVQGHPELSASIEVLPANTAPNAHMTIDHSGGANTPSSAGGASPTAPTSGVAGQRNGTEICLPTTITREATAEEAKGLTGSAGANTATTTLTFNVGQGAGNATDGHFDLGPAIDNGTLVARVKDDRRQPASWVDPSSLTFALGDAAKLSAPEALSFIAPTGSQVWMIPATQIAGVPWLGMNSQREEIVNGTRGGVTFTLDAMTGPGKVAVFASGSLGSGVGEKVFNGVGSSYVLPANTHAHYNWVFTEAGTYTMTISMKVTPTGEDLKGSGGAAGRLTPTGEKGPNGLPMVSEVVGRTPTGKECSLAKTGADIASVVPLALLVALVGGGAVLLRQRRTR
ncbi:TIGR03773 family transporter-associated surface protein [Schaalia suimastitidis]|uniref:TIGR03773 family transporter-associated surface protein n=1 Tax=Schaalia suimastitidis TaxID=121163 RepID=UPI000686DF7C|nr:TIGR03773 family transporter-associated surface protein [Schaalia suimastitidis]